MQLLSGEFLSLKMRFKAKKQPTVTSVEELEESPIKPSCGFFRLWKTLFWKHRPRVDPAVTFTAVESLVARRLPKERGKRSTVIGESGAGDNLVTNHHRRFLVEGCRKTDLTVEEEEDLSNLSEEVISPYLVDRMSLFETDSELSSDMEISLMPSVESRKARLSDVDGLSRPSTDSILSDVRQSKALTKRHNMIRPEFFGPSIEDWYEDQDDDTDVEFDAISWKSFFSSTKHPRLSFRILGQGIHRAEVLSLDWDW